MITIHKASFVSEPSQRRPRKQQQHRLSLPTCTKQIPAKCHTNELKKTGIANTKAPRRELFITHTRTCNERNHKCQTEGHLQPKLQATLTTWVEAETKVCKEATCQAKQAAYKAVVHQPTAKPVHFQQTKHHLCLNQPNIAVKFSSIMKCQAKQAADKTVVHHQFAKLAAFH